MSTLAEDGSRPDPDPPGQLGSDAAWADALFARARQGSYWPSAGPARLTGAVVAGWMITRSGHAGSSAAGLALLGVLMLASQALQVRSRRRRPARMVSAGEDPGAGDEVPLGYGVPMGRAAESFSQQHCTVTCAAGGGNVNTDAAAAGFLVVIAGGHMSVVEPPGLPLFTVPATAVQIITPRWRRRIFGAGSILKIGGQLWSVQFGPARRAQAGHACKTSGLRVMLTACASLTSIRRGREINGRFTCALLEAGASDALQPAARGAFTAWASGRRPRITKPAWQRRRPLRPQLKGLNGWA